ncbi:MAG TPA: hypothetical protein PKD55_00890 [Bellilinea sp.]|mgnify:CR=1 FL=1|nr:hypothetical protein [Bellilinea sp.]
MFSKLRTAVGRDELLIAIIETPVIGPVVNRLAGRLWNVKRRLLTGYCWWAGHDVQRGDVISGGWQMYQLTPDYCARCLHSADERDLEEGDFWHAAHRVYVWVCEVGGEPWERVDLWLQSKISLPSWWEH